MRVLHGVSPSPFVRKVRVALAEKHVEYELEAVMPGGASAAFKKLNPLGKIPVYQDGEFVLPDSSAICAYLERAWPDPPLYPADDRDYGRALWFEEYADTKLIDVIVPIFAQRVLQPVIFKQAGDESIVEQHLTQLVPPAFDYLESQVRAGDWLVGDSFGIADISMGSLFVNLRHARESVDDRWPGLRDYVERVHARESFAAIIAEEEALLASL